MKNKIVDLLLDELSYIYCDNCKFNDVKGTEEAPCDECHRKNMHWEASDKFCQQIANKIIDIKE